MDSGENIYIAIAIFLFILFFLLLFLLNRYLPFIIPEHKGKSARVMIYLGLSIYLIAIASLKIMEIDKQKLNHNFSLTILVISTLSVISLGLYLYKTPGRND